MSFLNVALLAGIAAIAVPIAIHLLSRRQPKRVPFPSIVFLQKPFEVHSTRLKIRKWWLLAARIALIAAAAFALAGPMLGSNQFAGWIAIAVVMMIAVLMLVVATVLWSGGRASLAKAVASIAGVALLLGFAWGGYSLASGAPVQTSVDPPIAVGILVDNSLTSAWLGKREADAVENVTPSESVPSLKILLDTTADLIRSLPRGSTVVLAERGSAPLSVSLGTNVIGKLEQIQTTNHPSSIEAKLRALARRIEQVENPNRHIVLITSATEDGIGVWLEDPAASPNQIPFHIVRVGIELGENQGITAIDLADPTPPPETPVAIEVELAGAPGEVNVELEVFESDPALPATRDGKIIYPPASAVDRTTSVLSGRGSSKVVLNMPGLPIGIHQARVTLSTTDAFPLDDSRSFSVLVRPPSPVVIVGDNESEVDILVKTLQASPTGSATSSFEVQSIEYGDLRLAVDGQINSPAETQPVWILMDPPTWAIRGDDSPVGRSPCMVLMGPSLQAGTITRQTNAPESKTGDARRLELVRTWRVPPPGSFLVPQGSHPITDPFDRSTPWSALPVFVHWQVEPQSQDRVIMSFASSGHPALIESIEPARCLWVTTPLPALNKVSRDWNDLFGADAWPTWLLIRNSVEYLANQDATATSVPVGTTASFPLALLSQLAPKAIQAEADATTLTLYPPEGELPAPVTASEGVITWSQTDLLGTYWIRGLDSPASGFAVNLNEGHVKGNTIPVGDVRSKISSDAEVVESIEELQWISDETPARVPLSSPAILIVAALFITELAMSSKSK
ncbi:MAG: BatA domain-containing protein [Planctomycetota bacterium]